MIRSDESGQTGDNLPGESVCIETRAMMSPSVCSILVMQAGAGSSLLQSLHHADRVQDAELPRLEMTECLPEPSHGSHPVLTT